MFVRELPLCRRDTNTREGDVGGQRSLRPYWRNYFEKTDAIVWVVDSSDPLRMEDCRAELWTLLGEEVRDSGLLTLFQRLAGASLLIFANKQDIPGALSPEQINQVCIASRCTDHSNSISISTKFKPIRGESKHAVQSQEKMWGRGWTGYCKILPRDCIITDLLPTPTTNTPSARLFLHVEAVEWKLLRSATEALVATPVHDGRFRVSLRNRAAAS